MGNWFGRLLGCISQWRRAYAGYGKRQKEEGRRQRFYYWYVVVWVVKESPSLYGDSYNSSIKRSHFVAPRIVPLVAATCLSNPLPPQAQTKPNLPHQEWL
jgi:hypothetical protein